MKVIEVKPKDGLKIRNPRDGRPLPTDRTTRVEVNQYWVRRIQCGDVYECSDEDKQEPKKVLKVRKKKFADKPEELGEENAD